MLLFPSGCCEGNFLHEDSESLGWFDLAESLHFVWNGFLRIVIPEKETEIIKLQIRKEKVKSFQSQEVKILSSPNFNAESLVLRTRDGTRTGK